MESAGDGYREATFVARYLARLEPEVAALPDGPLRTAMVEVGDALANQYGMPKIGELESGDLLIAARDEMFARLHEVGAEPFMPMTPEQGACFMRGLPFSMDTLADFSAECVHKSMPQGNNRPPVFLAQAFHFCGIWTGVVAAQFRR